MKCPYCQKETIQMHDMQELYYPNYMKCKDKDHFFIYYCFNDFMLMINNYSVERIRDIYYYNIPGRKSIHIPSFELKDIVRTLNMYRNLAAFL